MKKTILTLALMAIAIMGAAQTKTYRQNINQEIRQLIVQGNCIVHLQQDTENWVAYKGTEKPDTARLVIIENNVLTTTPAANNKILYIGTTAGKDCNLEFEVKDDASVLYNDKLYSEGRTSTRTYNTDDTPKKETSDWTGLKKYTFSDRIHNQFYLGFNQNIDQYKTIPPKLISSQFLSHTAWHISYSLYMDDNIAAGIGLQWSQNRYKYSKLIGFDESDEYPLGYNFMILTGGFLGYGKSDIYSSSIDFPIHFTFFPNKEKHSFNIQLELIPQLNFICDLNENYSRTLNEESIDVLYSKSMLYHLLQLKTRFSINFGIIGAYAETGITPLLNYPNERYSLPFHLAFGLRLNLF